MDLDDSYVIETLEPLLRESRQRRIEEVIARRTYGLTMVLEDLYDDGNTSAIMRTCDAFGLQRVNLVTSNSAKFKCDRKISQGAHKWLDVRQFAAPAECIGYLKEEGYQIYASRLDEAACLDEIDFTRSTALVLGNEHSGVSDELAALCDGRFKIPMVGFVQSLNVSIAAGICLYHAFEARRLASGPCEGALSDEEKQKLRARYYRRAVRSSDLLLREDLAARSKAISSRSDLER